MVTSHTNGKEKYSSQSDSRSKHDTETANKTKSATLVRTAQVYGACEAIVCTQTQQGRASERGSTREFSLKQMNFLSTAKRKGNEREGALSVSIPRAC